MYAYIFDNFTSEQKYARQIGQINFKLADLDIIDEKVKATPLQSVETLTNKLLAEEKYSNIIAVGNDRTANQVINVIARAQKQEEVAFGIIPLGHSRIAQLCGIPEGKEACEIISARKIEKLDLGKIDNSYFLTSVEIKTKPQQDKIGFLKKLLGNKENFEIRVDFKNQFRINARATKAFFINLDFTERFLKLKKINPKDGLLNIVLFSASNKIQGKAPKISLFQADEVNVDSKHTLSIEADSQSFKRLPLQIKVLPSFLKVIVGKNRVF